MPSLSLELIFNLALLVALSVVAGFIEKRWSHQTRRGVLFQGLLFGSSAILGMLHPMDFGNGIIFDGRSVMVSLCSLFFGPTAGAVTAGMAILCRILLGGGGTLTGILVILASFGIGILGFIHWRPTKKVPSAGQFFLFGLVVHLTMLALMFTLPGGMGTTVVAKIGLPILLLFPAATILVGKILSDQVRAFHLLGDLEKSNQNLMITLRSIGDAVISTDIEGRIIFMNPVAEALTGWSQQEAAGKPHERVFHIISETTRKSAENPVQHALTKGLVVGLANHTILIARDGTERSIADSASPIFSAGGEISGAVLVFRDLSEERSVQRLKEARLALLETAKTSEVDHFITRAVEEIGGVFQSPIAFYQGLDADHENLPRQQWSSRALQESSQSRDWTHQEFLQKTGLWGECLLRKSPVVNNAYQATAATEKWPAGHPDIHRLMLIPVLHDGEVVAVMGLGNKPTDYTEKDLETAEFLVDEIREIIEKGQTESALRESENLFKRLFRDHAAAKLIIDPDTGRILDANPAAAKFYGWPVKQLKQMKIQDINTLSPDEIREEMERARSLHRVSFEFRHRCADGSIRDVAVLSGTIEFGGKRFLHSIVYDITARKLAEQALRASEERFRLLVENAPDAIFVQTKERFTYLNRTAIELFDAESDADLVGTPVAERFHPDFRDLVRKRMRTLNEEQQAIPLRHEVCLRMDGSSIDVEASAVPMTYDGENGALVFIRDISDRIQEEKVHRKLEDQLHQAQKIESVGRLAGGVAHDYNNMLGVIIGYAELGLMKVAPVDPLHDDLDQILAAAKRSRDITRQLLAFARKQTLAPQVLDLNEAIESMLKMLRHLIGENIDLAWLPGNGLWQVEMDPSQLDQILANLCVNARDAIADVGKVTIETETVSFGQDYCDDHPGFIPGDYVMFAVSDNGCGMDPETLSHLFEPFFTTKGPGEGTGLGLATVYGAIKQSGGFINVYSEPGKGTTFKLYLPRYAGQDSPERLKPEETLEKGQGELILLVEDEQLVLTLTERILMNLGYLVLTARNPAEALAVAKEHGQDIRLLLTDVVMPEMNGRELAKRLQAANPHLKCLYMSGYTANAIAHHGVLDKGLQFIQKPFSRYDLGRKIREVLRNGNG